MIQVHGATKYIHDDCRCEDCTDGHRERMRRRKAERFNLRVVESGQWVTTAQVPHGRMSTYTNWGCRCGECRQVWRQYQSAYRKLGRPSRAAKESTS